MAVVARVAIEGFPALQGRLHKSDLPLPVVQHVRRAGVRVGVGTDLPRRVDGRDTDKGGRVALWCISESIRQPHAQGRSGTAFGIVVHLADLGLA